jgi:hypothetical protein
MRPIIKLKSGYLEGLAVYLVTILYYLILALAFILSHYWRSFVLSHVHREKRKSIGCQKFGDVCKLIQKCNSMHSCSQNRSNMFDAPDKEISVLYTRLISIIPASSSVCDLFSSLDQAICYSFSEACPDWEKRITFWNQAIKHRDYKDCLSGEVSLQTVPSDFFCEANMKYQRTEYSSQCE